ncbi:MAG: hypothetical protein U9O82_02275 [Thermodesulfobacteriota bacterium]|nr:hypothetical protein [Thermodesulfobacteriota bacterium]
MATICLPIKLLNFKRASLSPLTIGFFMMGTAVAADINQYKGKWINTDKNTRGITKIFFNGDGGGKMNIHVWGKCSPRDCDWGWKNCNSYADGHLSARYRNDFVTVQTPLLFFA